MCLAQTMICCCCFFASQTEESNSSRDKTTETLQQEDGLNFNVIKPTLVRMSSGGSTLRYIQFVSKPCIWGQFKQVEVCISKQVFHLLPPMSQ